MSCLSESQTRFQYACSQGGRSHCPGCLRGAWLEDAAGQANCRVSSAPAKHDVLLGSCRASFCNLAKAKRHDSAFESLGKLEAVWSLTVRRQAIEKACPPGAGEVVGAVVANAPVGQMWSRMSKSFQTFKSIEPRLRTLTCLERSLSVEVMTAIWDA